MVTAHSCTKNLLVILAVFETKIPQRLYFKQFFLKFCGSVSRGSFEFQNNKNLPFLNLPARYTGLSRKHMFFIDSLHN